MSEPISWRGDTAHKACVGEAEPWFTSGITQRFGVAPAQASERASECWVNGVGKAARPEDVTYFII
ncbi:hypothetical protein Desaci_0534 [Desulfosporosinus acidiphilus SJ4]|uniref:Uncharacterized protein n=1 Tax=Desulfosporosinus acidiphilus (strain DSM 22704 / JCM 16185 / SJ4) TaxID=646529 RepID=I4D1C6_DESAJ|nr:hypothetical protein Desaci_0534 [Desulfosporosinus acidiphilus SJ4]